MLDGLDEASGDAGVSPQRVAELVEEATQLVARTTPFAGVAVVIDELGQHLDYVARQGDERDLFVLQTLAEMAARSGQHPCVIITILHQAFEQYARTAGVSQRTEWAKVQGRFIDIPFQEPVSQLLRMVGQALAPQGDDPDAEVRQVWANQLAPLTEGLAMRPPEIGRDEWQALLAQTYRLHPTVLVALPLLFRQLAQNERSLFAFLNSEEPWSLRDVLYYSETDPDGLVTYRLPHLYRYVEASLGASLFGQARGRRWAELAEALIRAPDVDEVSQAVLTTIGTISALGQSSLLRASRDHVAFALQDAWDAADVLRAIEQLQARRQIIYRQHRDSYLLWEGSDLDLEGLAQAATRQLSDRLTLPALLDQHAKPVPLVARRHSYVTGAVRQFDVRFVAVEDLPKIGRTAPQGDGEVLYVVPTDTEALQTARRWTAEADRATELQRIVVLPRQAQRLRDLLLEVAALQRVLTEQPELEHDRVAKRELASRLIEAQQALAEAIASTYAPGYSDWWWRGHNQPVGTMRELDALLSRVCDETYHATPRIWNELIMRRQLTSMGAKARRNLIEVMLDHAHVERLGLVGYPPERAIYESVFRVSGIHRQDDDRHWRFGPPTEEDPLRLRAVWTTMQRFLDSTAHEARPVTELYAELEAPPYGIKAGLLPLLFMAIYLANAGEVALYEHRNYVPVPDIAIFERLIRQPGYFAVRLSRISGERVAVYERLARALAPGLLARTNRPAILDAVIPLLRVVNNLPEYSRHTQRVSEQAQAIRHAALTTRAPDELIFELLPAACGVAPFAADAAPDEEHLERFFTTLRTGLNELQDAYPQLNMVVAQRIQTAFGAVATEFTALRDELAERYRQIGPTALDTQLRAFGVRVENGGPDTAWIESVAALVGRKPLNTWRDSDVASFELHVADLGRRFQAAEQLAVAVGAVPSTAHVLRIGLTDAQGERSIVIQNGHPDPAMQALQRDLAATLEQYATLTMHQQMHALAEVLGPLLDQARRSSEQ
jgi:hypothetical protein